jgi:hypothetical protein
MYYFFVSNSLYLQQFSSFLCLSYVTICIKRTTHHHHMIHCSSRTNKTSRRENVSRADCSTNEIIQPRGERMTAIECKSYPVFRDFLLLDIIIIIFFLNNHIGLEWEHSAQQTIKWLRCFRHLISRQKKNYFVIGGGGDNQSIDESIPQSTSSIRHFSP